MELLKKLTDYGIEIIGCKEYVPLGNSGSAKKEVSCTYRNHDGYALIFACLGMHGYMFNCGLRLGNRHNNKGPLEFIRQSLGIGVERLPSSKVATNSILLLLMVLSFDALCTLGLPVLQIKSAIKKV